MYEDVVMIAQSTVREFEDLKKMIYTNAPRKDIDEEFDKIILRAKLFRKKFRIVGSRRMYLKLKFLRFLVEKNIERHKPSKVSQKLIDRIELRFKKLRDSAVLADKEDLPHAQFSFY